MALTRDDLLAENLKSIIEKSRVSTKSFGPVVEGGCECCGTWAGMEEFKYGDFVSFSDLENLWAELHFLANELEKA